MNPTFDWLQAAEACIRKVLDEVEPILLEAQGKVEHHLKPDNTVVTEMDTMVEDRLREALHAFDAGVDFSGEEGGADYDKQTFWLTDPIDGTEPFMRGLPFATNMIALIDNGQPIMGIVNNFGRGHYYLAIKGHGATRNGHPIHVSERPIERAFISVGATKPEYRPQPSVEDQLRDKLNVPGIVKFQATGTQLVDVANGGIEAHITYMGRPKPWDFAPGALIIQEAGGRVVNVGSDNYDYRNINVLVSNAVVFDQLNEFLKQFPKPVV